MKALTLWQPWATLVSLEAKKVETRSWNTTYRGPLAIHASTNKQYINVKSKNWILGNEFFFDVIGLKPCPLGCIVATCNLVAVVRMDEAIASATCNVIGWDEYRWDLTPQERAFGLYKVGRYMWLLEDIQFLSEPIPTKGARGLWEWNCKEFPG